jgi:NAD(P)-dependent dehydrogenase (short-subunit alcohol dehydrogenase family)/acyl dehydratase/putative sterol carrier protein
MGTMNGKVVVITGAGGGLGRAHALAFAREGASIVVNDLGGSRDGTGTGSSMAEKVCDEIKKMGGKAVPNFDSVSDPEGAERIVQTAIKSFGRLDVLVNNAGILRDKTLLKMTDAEWKPVMAVHLDGTFYCGRAAAKYWADNKIAGRMINTTSYSGLKGNYGQCNYGAAKAGVVALTKIWAMELAKYGITCNAIAPMAKTRMTEDIEAVPDDTQPEHISPLVVFLGSDLSSDVSGRIFGCHGRHFFEYKLEITEGVKKDTDWTPSEIKTRLDAISASASAAAAAPVAASAATASDGGGLKGRIAKAFGLMETAFTADKAAGWTANIQFTIEGADNYTLDIANKTCKVKPGLVGTPTCKVSTNADTMAGMIEGKVSGQSAFMSGKIKASSLGDMMKFGKVFDFKRAREAAAKGGSVAGTAMAAAPSVDLGAIFDKLGTAFLPDATAGWNGKICFDAGAAGAFTISIQNKQCQITRAKEAGATCTITAQASDIADVLTGRQEFKSAVTSGKLKVSNPMALVKLHQAFNWKSLAGAAPAAAASASEPAVTADGSVSQSIVGRRYRSAAMFVKPDKIREYASATNDTNSMFTKKTNDRELISPPVFPVTLVGDVFKQMLSDDTGIDLSRMVHGEQSIVYYDTIRAWDLISPRGKITKVERRGNNDVVHFEQNLFRDGELVARITSSLVVRGAGGASAAKPADAPHGKTSDAPAGKPLFTHVVKVDTDQPKRYAHASGDHNPIHIDQEIAKASGFPTVILHGLCTMALAGHAVVEKVLAGDPRRLREFSVRFSKPVFPGDQLTVTAFEKEKGEVLFNAVNAAGVPVLTQGVARYDAGATN